jgi:hypothetical protein
MAFFNRITILILLVIPAISLYADVPPGWEFTVTPSSHIFSIPESAWPVINSNPIEPGDYIGVFYDDNGDDAITGVKDGFDYQEPIQWRLYSQAMQVEVMAAVQLDPTYPTPGDVFIPEGMSGVLNIAGGGFYVFAYADEDNLCQGYYTQLHAEPGGGSGSYTFEWTSDPSGFTSTEQNPWVQVNDTTTYTVTVFDGTNTCFDHTIINAIPHPEVDAGDDDTICQSQNFSCSATYSNAPTITWTTTGDGTFNFPHSPTAIYTPGSNDITNGSVCLAISANAYTPCDLIARDTVEVTILPPPSAAAGDDGIICENGAFFCNGTANNYSSVQWISTGNGTFTNPNALNTEYITESVSEEITVTITLQAFGNTPCGNAYDSFELTISPKAEASAGTDQTICEDEDASLSGTAAFYDNISWSTPGDGTFSDNSIISPEYTPGQQDLSNGSVYLTLTAASSAPCTAVVADSMLLTFHPLPEVFAGYNQVICSLDNVLLNGIAGNTSSSQWSSSGDGTFENAALPSTTYYPGNQDLSNGSVTLTLQGEAVAPCTGSTSDDLSVTFINPPQANAGEDDAICTGETYTTQGSVSNTTTSFWSASGSGFFADPSQTSTTYTPSEDDYNSGEVILTLTAEANSACGAQSDAMTLIFYALPSVYAGQDQVIPFGTFTQLQGEVSGGSGDYTHQWEPQDKIVGQGILDPVTVNLENSVLFTLSSTDNISGCVNQDNMAVFVSGGALSVVATATPEEVCPGEDVNLLAVPSGGAGDYTFSWSSDPAGFSSEIADPTVNPEITTTYTVEIYDGFNTAEGSVTVTVFEPPDANAGDDQDIYHGTSTLLEGNASGGSGLYSWQWVPAAKVVNPSQQSSETTQLYQPVSFELTVTDNETGCTDKDQTAINLLSGALEVTPSGIPNPVCVGETVQLSANAQGGAPDYSYSWYSEPPGFFSTEENPQITAEEPLRIWVEADDGWNSSSGFFDLTLFTENQLFMEVFPDDTVCSDQSITLTVSSMVEAVSWEWSPVGGNTPEITFDSTGLGSGRHTFTVSVTDINGCRTSANKNIWFDLCTDISELPTQNLIITPNPAKDYVRIQNTQSINRINVIDMSGKIIFQKEDCGTEIYLHLKENGIISGIYLIQLESGEEHISGKLIVY